MNTKSQMKLMPDERYCPDCGTIITKSVAVCIACGHRLRGMPEPLNLRKERYYNTHRAICISRSKEWQKNNLGLVVQRNRIRRQLVNDGIMSSSIRFTEGLNFQITELEAS